MPWPRPSTPCTWVLRGWRCSPAESGLLRLLLFFLEQIVGKGLGTGNDAGDVGVLGERGAVELALGFLALYPLGRLLPRPLLAGDLFLPLGKRCAALVGHRLLPPGSRC